MRRLTVPFACAALAACGAGASGSAAPEPPAEPQRIMSMNQCTDLLVLQLAPKARIVSVTYLAGRAAEAIAPRLAEGVGVNHGTAEEIVTQKPDLILAGDFSTPMTKQVARRAGVPLVEVKSATTFEEIRQITRQVGVAVGEPERAEALIAEMDATLAELAATAPPEPYVVAAWSGESVPGRMTLANTIIEAAGATNVASLLDNDRYNTFGLEELLAARPDVLMYGVHTTERPSLVTARAQHPVIQRLYADRRITYSEALYTCGLPQSAAAARDLRIALAGVTGR